MDIWVNADGELIVDDAGAPIECDDCPCEDNPCPYCTGPLAAELMVTASGVVGCEGRCDANNVTAVLTPSGTCEWSVLGYRPLLCSGIYGGRMRAYFTGPSTIEVEVIDETALAFAIATFSGTFTGDACNGITATLSSPTIVYGGTNIDLACEDCLTADPSYGWCYWEGATLEIEAVP